jgi:periplasmic protein TonB
MWSRPSVRGLVFQFCILAIPFFSAIAQNDGRPMRVAEAVARQSVKYRVDPEYPATARQFKIAGDVITQITIGTDGKVESIDDASGNQLLKASATAALRKWVFSPFVKDGKPVKVQTSITFQFHLHL